MMQSPSQTDSFVTLERCELKYHVPIEFLPRLERLLAPWCGLDAHSEKSSDGFYWVTSLYLDGPGFPFWGWKQAGLSDRYNMRIRSYGENPSPDSDRFFEIKRKRGQSVTKHRGTWKGGHAEELWSRPPEQWKPKAPFDVANLERFWRCSTRHDARPVVLTQYRRIAWFGRNEDYARVTLDTQMRWREERGFDFSMNTLRSHPSGLPGAFTPGTNAVLELKCPLKAVPQWMVELVQALGLVRSSFSKYGNALLQMNLSQRLDAPVRQAAGVSL